MNVHCKFQEGGAVFRVSQIYLVTAFFFHKGVLETIVSRKMLWRTLAGVDSLPPVFYTTVNEE